MDEQLRVTNDIDEQNVADFQFHIGRGLGRHEFLLSRYSRFHELSRKRSDQ